MAVHDIQVRLARMPSLLSNGTTGVQDTLSLLSSPGLLRFVELYVFLQAAYAGGLCMLRACVSQ